MPKAPFKARERPVGRKGNPAPRCACASVVLDPVDLARLDLLARQQGRSRSALIRDAIRQTWLNGPPSGGCVTPAASLSEEQRLQDNQDWMALMERIRSRIPAGLAADEIEADITAASEEVRALRLAAHRR